MIETYRITTQGKVQEFSYEEAFRLLIKDYGWTADSTVAVLATMRRLRAQVRFT